MTKIAKPTKYNPIETKQTITGTEFLVALRKHEAEERKRMVPIEMAMLRALLSR